MRLLPILLVGVVSATPTQNNNKNVASLINSLECKIINDVVATLTKVAPAASKYCSSVLNIKTVTTTSTASVTNTASVTVTGTTTTTISGGPGGTVTITAPAVIISTTTTSTSTTTTFDPSCTPQSPVNKKRGAPAAKPSCAGAPVGGFACSALSKACSCLGLPTPTTTVKTTVFATRTNTATATSTITTYVPTTTTTTPTSTTTTTVVASATACIGLPTCNNPFTCDNGNFVACAQRNQDLCFCLTTPQGGLCLDVSNGCGTSCGADNSCPSGQYCALNTCCGNVCLTIDTCIFPNAPARLFRRGEGVGRRGGKYPGVDPGLYTPQGESS